MSVKLVLILLPGRFQLDPGLAPGNEGQVDADGTGPGSFGILGPAVQELQRSQPRRRLTDCPGPRGGPWPDRRELGRCVVIPVTAAFWLRANKEDSSYLYIASDEFNDKKLGVGYGEVLRIAAEMRDPNFDPFRVKLVRPGDLLSSDGRCCGLYTRLP
jgi:hypothetical protein